ncbi:hypothetical protein J4E83_008956 [Alternaria metachromatica]|uniref:uncharacterized protein n=1 Tax=Alternaria metachromatica TaxID=283354 RepID=UPI0020C2AEBA|nr:uncharacterized protein J4E83_008956 [Alternaria metachromatica]KAI4608917.1 hypothetical protein J4E83_008956 [Alternaria metachromatica]
MTTRMKTKAVAHSDDLTFIITMLYQPNYLSTFGSMRLVLNLTLYMLLVVDTCGRGAGEFARNPVRPEYMCLRWEDIEFYSFQCDDDDDDEFDIRAQVKIRWRKGKTLDDSAYKTVPFPGLLPTSMALQDTLRLLLTLAMMDDIRSWDGLRSLRLPAEVASTGRRLKIRPSMREVPVLRKMIDHRLTKMPQWTTDMQSEIRRLGQFCGFEESLVAYCMGRGVAYTLATRASEEDRVFLMGHSRQVRIDLRQMICQ